MRFKHQSHTDEDFYFRISINWFGRANGISLIGSRICEDETAGRTLQLEGLQNRIGASVNCSRREFAIWSGVELPYRIRGNGHEI
jgi:hypothetical protein